MTLVPEPGGIYLIELCSGEQRRWRHLGSEGECGTWWRDLETGREFSEASVLYAWSILRADAVDAAPGNTINVTPPETTVPVAADAAPDHRAIVAQIADAIVYADAEGLIREWNAAATRLFGFEADEAIGRSLDLIIPERLRAAHWAGFDAAMTRGATRHAGRPTRTKALTRAGIAIYVEMSFAVVADAAGRAVGSVAVARAAERPAPAPPPAA